ncbi:hypothetical protein V5N15_03760 [Ligilactobacillus salivarius]|uniref:hypothetical protein n=1 Tax=Ligilactobacillus salivarius TaxID=1624 RepID=UPI003315823D
MKINFKNKVKSEDMYKVGNVIKTYDNSLFLVVEVSGHGYALVNLSDNMVSQTYETLESLAEVFWHEDDVLVNAEINEI